MQRLSLTDARAQLPHLLDRVAAGESFTITRHGVSIAVLTGHDDWMKTKTHDAILQARELGERIDAARGQPFDLPQKSPELATADSERAIAELERDRESWDERDPRGPLH